MRDRNSGSRGLGVWLASGLFLPLAFTAGAASAGDNAAFVSYTGVPSAMHPGDTATVTVKMKNTGTTTWRTSVETENDGSTQTTTRTTYSLKALGHGWSATSRVVSGSVAPNATVAFSFTITAPQTTTKRNYVFRWQMARDTVVTERPIHARSAGTFGAATPSRTIQVGPDEAPSFGTATIADQEWTKRVRITPVVLPEATGGNGPLSYALTCSLPNGVTFKSSTRTISGTPGRLWAETTCTWKVTDADDNTAAGDSDTLTFTVEVVEPDTAPEFPSGETIDDQEWTQDERIEPVELPTATGGNGTLSYSLSCSLPTGVELADKTISGTPSVLLLPGRECTWKVTDADDNTGASDADTLTFTIKVEEPNTAPVFDGPVGNQMWLENTAIEPIDLPGATGGNGELSFALDCSLPTGVSHNPSTRRISGTPRTELSERKCKYTVTDSDDDTSASDSDKLEFTIEVEEDEPPEFSGTVPDQMWLENTAITPVVLPDASGGNGTLSYTLNCSLPSGVSHSQSRRRISGTPRTALSERECTYTVTDSDGNTSASDADTLTFTIEVERDTAPVFDGTVSDYRWERGSEIAPVSLPRATGGNGSLRYTFDCLLPGGLTFEVTSKTISGTPTVLLPRRTCTWKVTDSDGDMDTETFTIEVVPPPDTAPVFDGGVADQRWVRGTAIDPVAMPGASDGNGTLSYTLTCSLPRGVTYSGSSRRISGTPETVLSETTCTYTVTDSDDNTAASDADTLTFTITVSEPDTAPEFSGPADDLE